MAKLITATYGDALFDVAVEGKAVDSLYEEASTVLKSFEENEEHVKMLNHPNIEKEDKIETVKNIYSQFVSMDMTGFLVTMVSKDRQKNIVKTLQYFQDKVKEYKKIGVVNITTARKLTDVQMKKVEEKLLETTKYTSFEFHYKIDESLIGGMIIRIGDRVVDSSIKTKLDEMSKELKKIQLG